MKHPLKALSLVALLSIMIAPFALAVGFLIRQQLIVHETFEKLEQGSHKTYQLSLQEISWIKEGKELLVHGKMFDVKHFKIKNNYIEITGIFDEEEDALYKQYSSLTNPLKNKATPLQLILIKTILSPVFFEKNQIEIASILNFDTSYNSYYYAENSLQKNYPVNLPPPKYL